MNHPVTPVMGTTADAGSQDLSGSLIAQRYKLIHALGEGGMGSVWLAEQIEPVHRQVAVKVIRPGMDSAQIIARFEAERQALALMDHPNIAKVFDAGLTGDQRPFLVMELVRGVPLTTYCNTARLDLRQRLELFVQVCQAVQHAHQKGVIHRDLKPSNILVTLIDGRAVPKVIDFGVAKALHQKLSERTVFTEVGSVVGTLEYMSPEQADLTALDIDTRSDIYSLGVILYELLAGKRPFDAQTLRRAGLAEMLRIIKEVEPPRPSTRLSKETATLPGIAADRRTEPGKLTRSLRGDLDWIVMKALEKERSRRYETANGFAMDIQRYLADEPVLAGPPSASYRLRKFFKRNQGPVIGAALLLLALMGGIVGTTWQMFRAIGAEHAARANEEKALAAADAERQAKDDEARQRKEAEAALRLLEGLYRGIAPGAQRKEAEDLRAVLEERLDAAAAQLEKDFAGEPLTKARLQHALGEAQHSLGDAKKAVILLEASIATRLAARGNQPPDFETLVCMADLASSLQAAGRLDDAISQGRETLTLMKTHLGPNHPVTVRTMNELGSAYHAAGRHQEALPLYEESLNLQRAAYPGDALVLARFKNNLAVLLRDLARYEPAEALYKEVIAVQTERLGPNHPDTLTTKDNLASLYLDLGRPAAAVELCRAVFAARAERLGPDHVATHRSRGNLANALQHAGNVKDALPLLEESLQRDKLRLGPDHPSTLSAISNLAVAYRAAGRSKDALPLFEQAFQLRKTKLGPDHPATLVSMNNLAIGYADVGRQAESLALQEELLELRKVKLGADHPETLVSMDNLAGGYVRSGRAQQAVPLLEESLRRITARLGADHPDTIITRSNLSFALSEVGRTREAIPLALETLGIAKAKLGPDHPTTLTAMNNLASLYRDEKRWDEAAPLFEETLRLIHAKLGPTHPYAIRTTANLAATYQLSGQPAKAIPLHEAALKLRREQKGPDAPDTLDSMVQLAAAYLAADQKPAEAEVLLREALAGREKLMPDAWQTASTRALLGRALTRRQKLAEAEPLLLKGYEDLKARVAQSPTRVQSRLAETAADLVRLYESLGKPDEAKKWRDNMNEPGRP